MRRFLLASALLAPVLLAPAPASAASDRLTVIISDLHLGGEDPPPGAAAHPWEDFRWTADLRGFLDDIAAEGASRHSPVDLVIAGDFLELWQSTAGDCRPAGAPMGCTEAEAVGRVRRVVEHHRADLFALGQFASGPGQRLVIVPGNHDAALLYADAAKELVAALRVGAPSADVTVASGGYYLSDDGGLLVEHGHQVDLVNRFVGWPRPFLVDAGGAVRLERPDGEVFVLDFFQGLETRWAIIDNTTDDVAVAEWLAGSVSIPDKLGAIWSLFKAARTMQNGKGFAAAKDDGGIPWAVDKARAEGDSLLWRLSPPELRSAQPPEDAGRVARMSNEEIASVCEAVPVDQEEQCLQRGSGDAGAALQSAEAKARALGAYVARRRADLQAPVRAYVFGHTHEAIGTVAAGGDVARVVNDGAFQRVVEVPYLLGLVGEADPVAWLDARGVADLPACYSFVMVTPYREELGPRPELRYWTTLPQGKGRSLTTKKAPHGCVVRKGAS